MGDAQDSDAETITPNLIKDLEAQLERRPFGGLEFQVSEVVERLEAGVNSQESGDEDRRSISHKSSSSFFEPEASPLGDILHSLEDLVRKTDSNNDCEDVTLLPTNSAGRAAILSHSLAALFGRLERSHASRLGAHIASETTLWLSHMFRLKDYQAYYHQEQLEGLVRVVRMLLHHRYPRYLEDGALAFSNRLPCIYSSVASPLGIVQHLCRQLSLPLACVRPIPVSVTGRGMDLEALNRYCEEDVQGGRYPLLVLAEAGAPPLGSAENLNMLHEICTERRLHLHIRGHALALPAAMGRNQVFSIADSLTLTPGLWFGINGLPIVTLYRIPEPVTVNDISKPVSTNTGSREGTLAALAGLSGGSARVPALPLWCAMRSAGARALIHSISSAFVSARAIYTVLSTTPGIKLYSDPPGGDEPPNVDIINAISEASCCVIWQFAPTDSVRPPPYYDKLNSWLGQVLQREADMINVEVTETETHGVVLRYCPLEGSLLDMSKVQDFSEILNAQLQILQATVALRDSFQNKVNEHPMLKLIHVPGWAGLGGVRYVPPEWEEASVEDLNSLNRQLVDTLRATDGAFSCGESEDGLACVRFGMVTEDTDVGELLDLVVSAGREVEESSKALSTMSEVLKKGIEEAQADLERENAERLWQEGLLRRVPVVGRVVGWWAPSPVANTQTVGRRLHLHQGKLQTTQDVYQAILKKEAGPARAHSPARPPQ